MKPSDKPMGSIATEYLCSFKIEFIKPQIFGTPFGRHMNLMIKTGIFEGPKLKGIFLPGGGDWVTTGFDDVTEMDVRATLLTEDGAHIKMESKGRVCLPKSNRKRFIAGEFIEPDEMYARSSPLFSTSDDRYQWINNQVNISVISFSLTEVHYQIYTVK